MTTATSRALCRGRRPKIEARCLPSRVPMASPAQAMMAPMMTSAIRTMTV